MVPAGAGQGLPDRAGRRSSRRTSDPVGLAGAGEEISPDHRGKLCLAMRGQGERRGPPPLGAQVAGDGTQPPGAFTQDLAQQETGPTSGALAGLDDPFSHPRASCRVDVRTSRRWKAEMKTPAFRPEFDDSSGSRRRRCPGPCLSVSGQEGYHPSAHISPSPHHPPVIRW